MWLQLYINNMREAVLRVPVRITDGVISDLIFQLMETVFWAIYGIYGLAAKTIYLVLVDERQGVCDCLH